MNRRQFISLCGAFGVAAAINGAGCTTTATATAARRKPNVVLIVADDLGYGELSAQGSKDILTPNIDSIAKNGVRFTDGYVTCPVCSPTRAGLMTGRYQQRFGHEFNPGPAGTEAKNVGLPLSETTFPQRMKQLGYATGMVGKWHLGGQDGFHPMDRGFDEYYGFLGGAHSYVNAGADAKNPILRGREAVKEISYTTDDFAREACDFINRHKDHPFFLYMPFNAVHAPMDALENYLAPFASISDEKRRKFAAMLSALDAGVGSILGALNANGLTGDTLVIFISDNGGPTAQISSKNDPLRGFKGQVLEGGIRVPYMMQWPGQIPAGVTYSQPVNSLDILPTAIAAAGGTLDASAKCEGVSLLPYLNGKASGAPHDALYWRQGENMAIRKGDFKLVKQAEEPLALYSLTRDIHEDKNLAAEMPEVVKELQADWDAWNARNVAPLWDRTQRPRQRQRAVTG
ncbi:MAG: sulfatase-like hydrolase/transferase [Candidatus Hydrogenedentes bacterium]|nr:sulfatase-like hydrolase/transferase [Candidatus Hydrogenedentota bacterium]